jgi:hypothetical protein
VVTDGGTVIPPYTDNRYSTKIIVKYAISDESLIFAYGSNQNSYSRHIRCQNVEV